MRGVNVDRDLFYLKVTGIKSLKKAGWAIQVGEYYRWSTWQQSRTRSLSDQADSFSRLDRSGELFRPCLSRGWYTDGGCEQTQGKSQEERLDGMDRRTLEMP